MGRHDKSTLFGEQKKAPDHQTLISMFLDAASDYFDLQKALPLPTSFPIPRGLARGDYWTMILHAAMLRKFFADQINFVALIKALQAITVLNDSVMERDLSDLAEWADAKTVPVNVGLNVNGHDVTQWEVVQMELYGRHLHADYSKWAASKPATPGKWDSVIGEWCGAASFLVEVMDMKVRWYAEKGFIDFTPQPKAEV